MYHVDQGDIDAGFSGRGRNFEDTYTSPNIQHGHIEPHAAIAYWEAAGKLVIYTSTQNPSAIPRPARGACSICRSRRVRV